MPDIQCIIGAEASPTNSVTDLPKWPSLLPQPQLLIYPTRPIENTPTQTHAKRKHRQYDNEIMTRLAWIAAAGRGGMGTGAALARDVHRPARVVHSTVVRGPAWREAVLRAGVPTTQHTEAS